MLVNANYFMLRGVVMLKRKDKIIISAIELLGEEGITGITIKNLAKSQKITEPALYRQFKNKQEIINYIIKEYQSYDEQIQETISQSNFRGKDAIIFYIERYSELYENYIELTTVMFSMDLYFYNENTHNIMRDIEYKRRKFLNGLVETYLEESGSNKRLDVGELSTCIDGIMKSEILEWRLNEETYSLKARISGIVNKML